MKKRTIIFCFILVFALGVYAQKVEYQTFIYTSDDLSSEISKQIDESKTRGFLGDLFNATLDASKGVASGYVTSFLDLGINAVGKLITKNKRNKEEWEKIIVAENLCETHIRTVSEINDFYSQNSFDGAMDPKGMRFDGIGCLRTEGNDTVFYISCHIDRSKINRIINHSKFELVLDTLIISPLHSNLPNSFPRRPFSFEERKDYNLSMDIKLSSSWMNEIVQLQKDQELGSFNINIPVSKDILAEDGFYRYVRQHDEQSRFKVVGESFIVPRSFMGYRDEFDNYKNSWGTGEFKMDITIKETCAITDEFINNWKSDYNLRKKNHKNDNVFETVWQTISNQRWDEITKSWVITTLKAPSTVIANEVNKRMGLKASTGSGSQQGAQQKTGNQTTGTQQGQTPPGGMPQRP